MPDAVNSTRAAALFSSIHAKGLWLRGWDLRERGYMGAGVYGKGVLNLSSSFFLFDLKGLGGIRKL